MRNTSKHSRKVTFLERNGLKFSNLLNWKTRLKKKTKYQRTSVKILNQNQKFSIRMEEFSKKKKMVPKFSKS